MIKEHYSDDPYRLMTYHRYKSNQAMWAGKFRTAIAHEFEALELARSANDSAFVSAQYRGIAEMYLALGEPDSSLVYTWKNYEWATQFRGLDHPLTLVEIDTAYKVEAKEILDSLTDDFRSRVPSEMWQIIDAVELVFEARCAADTTQLIASFRELMKNEDQQTTGNRYVLGSTLIADGQYSEGLELLKLIVSGNDQTTRGFFFIRALYQMGVAYEGLGNTQEAIANYERVLEYWGDPEIEIKEIVDTRQRLGRLIS
jgi:tetratricopeptide (TPR) repeat protein